MVEDADRPATVLFDGDCAYCNGWVNWIRRRDSKGHFRYASLQSEEGLVLRERYAVPPSTDSVVLITGGKAYVRSSAAWRILAALPGKRLLAGLLRVVPRFLGDLGYDLVARNRHRLGMKDACELPGR